MKSQWHAAGDTGECPLPFQLWLPDGDPAEGVRRPLVLFLHGRGERGADPEVLMQHGLTRALREGLELPAIVAAPQCPADSDWTEHLDRLAALLDVLEARADVDAGRMYLMGLSMGGRGAWHLVCLYPERFAALAVICGRRPGAEILQRGLPALRALPIWLFHGAQDTVVPVCESYAMAAALRAAGNRPRLTVYPDARHDSWMRTYRNPALYGWLFQKKREVK